MKWLQYSVGRGNYDLVQMRHGDFGELQSDPRFAELNRTVEVRAAGIVGAIRRWQAAAKSR